MKHLKFKNLNELGLHVKNLLPNQLVELSGEISNFSKVKKNIYFTIKDNYGNISAIIWNSNDIELREGNKITFIAKLDYYIPYGKLSLIVQEIKQLEDEGNIHKQYKQIKDDFEKLGYFLPENKLKLPNYLTNILVLTSTSDSAAAIRDFNFGLSKYNMNLNIHYENISVQGINCPKEIINYLNTNELNKYELVVITRGGGSFEDLFGFCQPELIECIYKLKVPVLSAIGHEIDTTLLDFVADYKAPTPSFAAEFIYHHNLNYITNLKIINLKIKEHLNNELYEKLDDLYKSIDIYKNYKNDFNNILLELQETLVTDIHNNLLFLENTSTKYQIDNNINIFDNNNKLIDKQSDFKSFINDSNSFVLNWGDSVLKINSFTVLNN